jgi:hypothetical protein
VDCLRDSLGDGELINRRIRTERPRLAEMFGRRPQARILLEASTESEWVARCLEDLGHEVIVADPNYAPMYARRTRRVKTVVERWEGRVSEQASKTGPRIASISSCGRSKPKTRVAAGREQTGDPAISLPGWGGS